MPKVDKTAPSLTSINMTRQFIFLALGWSVFTLFIMALDMRNTWLKNLDAGRLQAQVAIDKDMQYRFWSSRLGGVYGIISNDLQPNPYLHSKNRDLTTKEGINLTLINPAYMTRQVHELAGDNPLFSSHITSLNPLRPENKPDSWERDALLKFQQGADDIFSIVTEKDQQYMRGMKPLVVREPCLACHKEQGYRLGDIRGGLSVSIPMKEIRSLAIDHLITDYLLYLTVWLIGLIGLWFGSRRLDIRLKEQIKMESALHDFKMSLDEIDESVMMFDSNNMELFYANQGACNLLGMREEKMKGIPLPELIKEDQRYLFYTHLKPLFQQDEESFTVETLFLKPNGEEVPVEMHISYVVPRLNAERFLLVVRDITERKLSEKEKDTIQTQLLHAQKLESVGQLAAGIAHEINTPAQYVSANVDFFAESFTDIKEFIDSLKAKAQESQISKEELENALDDMDWPYLMDEIPSAINQSKDGMGWISSIVLAMKEFSHPGGKNKSKENLNKIIQITTTVCRNEWKYIAKLKTNFDDQLPMVPCMKDELGQVILNLIINASHAIAGKHESYDKTKLIGTITITTKIEDGFAVISVNDDGNGIPEKIRNRVFDPFFTTKEVGKGSGQGLAICRDVIETKHDGSLTFTTETGQGTTFYIKLPIEN